MLLPAVLLIWGLITYRILARDNEDYSPKNLLNNTSEIQLVPKNREYKLLYNYRDPFSGQQSYPDKLESPDDTKVQQHKIQLKWPAIRFNGYIINGNKIKCHLTIESEDKIFQENEKISDNYVVSKITSDSIEVSCSSESRWYKK